MSKTADKAPKTEAKAPAADSAREKNINLAVSSITKQFGEGSIMRLGQRDQDEGRDALDRLARH